MALTEMERATNRSIAWETVVQRNEDDPTQPATFGVRNPLSGELIATGLDQLQKAGYIISDLKTYGEIQPTHVY